LTLFPSIEAMEQIVHVIKVECSGEHRLRLQFEDGASGEVDLSSEEWGGIFAPLADPSYFESVRVDEELGTIVWPNGADIAPETLHRMVVQHAGGSTAGNS
jgi:hypothetical protein